MATLPLMPKLPGFSTVRPTLADRVQIEREDELAPTPEHARAMLGAAILQPEDLPGRWADDDLGTGKALFCGTEFQALFIADERARFQHAISDERIEQHIGLLPRWAVRHFADELDSAITTSLLPHGAQRSLPRLIELARIADQTFALRLGVTSSGGRDLSTDAVFLRRGPLVMALTYWRACGVEPEAQTTDTLARAADEKWKRAAVELAQRAA